jgi:hypothetical protein
MGRISGYEGDGPCRGTGAFADLEREGYEVGAPWGDPVQVRGVFEYEDAPREEDLVGGFVGLGV